MALMREIQARQTEFMKAFNGGNASLAASFYDSDCYFMPAEHDPVSGKAAVEAHFKKDLSEGLKSVEMKTEEVNGSGDWAFERGTYRAEGSLGPESGSYILVWHKVAGNWLIHNDCFNIVKPAPKRGR